MKVTATTAKHNYSTNISNGRHGLVADETENHGGTDQGFVPQELLASSLAACTSITLRMYANRKNMDIDNIRVSVEIKADPQHSRTIFERQIQIVGKISEAESNRLLEIADKCPVHKILQQECVIQTLMV